MEENTDEEDVEDDYDSDDYDDSERDENYNLNSSIHADEDDEEIGGAFARPSESPPHQREKRV